MKQQKPPLTKVELIEPMYARLVNELPEGRNGSTRSSSTATAASLECDANGDEQLNAYPKPNH
jgi:hypothetical protein